MKRLEAIGRPALEAVRRAATESRDVEIRRRAERLAGVLGYAELKELKGTWVRTSAELPARAASWSKLITSLVIDGRHGSVETDTAILATITLNPTTEPRSMDIKGPERTMPAIYAFDGHRLRVCIAESGSVRPTTFAKSDADWIALCVFERKGP